MDANVSPKTIAWLAGFLEGRFGLMAEVAHWIAAEVGEDAPLCADALLWTQTSEARTHRLRDLLDVADLPWIASSDVPRR